MGDGTLQGNVALVTGGASGIGLAAAMAYAAAGARVVVADLESQRAAGEECVQAIVQGGGEAIFLSADVSIEADVEALVRQAVKHFGQLDIAYNNAGIQGESNQTHLYSHDSWARVLEINLTGVWHCMKHELVHMRERGSGAIVNCASGAALAGVPGYAPYCASKHAVLGLTKSAAIENAPLGIRINAICPGVIDTPMFDRLAGDNEDLRAAMVASGPIGRAGQPAEVAAAVVWLSSPQSSFVTGHAMSVDGGWAA